MRLFRITYRIILITLHLCWGGIMMGLLVGANPDYRTERDWRFITSWMKRVCKILGLRISVSGSPTSSPTLLASNHISWHDIVVLQSLIATGFVGKHEIRDWPLIGWMAHRGNTLFIRRGQRDSAQQIKHAMQPRFANRQNIMIFPEGTTGTGESVLRFRSRLFEAATELHIPIQPVAIYYDSPGKPCKELAFVGNEAFVSHLLRTLDEPYINVRVHFCPSINTDKNDEHRELGKQTEEAVVQAFSNIQQLN